MPSPKILEEHQLHRGWLSIVRRVIEHPNGGVQNYEIVNPDSHSVSVVAFDESEAVLMIELYRFAQNKRLLELPAGAPRDGESFLDAARRELKEETGYDGTFQEVGSHYIAAEHGVTRHVFTASACKKVTEPDPDPSEQDEGIRLVRVSIDEFVDLVRSGQMTETAAGFMALDHLGLL